MAYIIQVQSAAWYVKLTDTLFGKKDVVHRYPVPVVVVRPPRRQHHSRPKSHSKPMTWKKGAPFIEEE